MLLSYDYTLQQNLGDVGYGCELYMYRQSGIVQAKWQQPTFEAHCGTTLLSCRILLMPLCTNLQDPQASRHDERKPALVQCANTILSAWVMLPRLTALTPMMMYLVQKLSRGQASYHICMSWLCVEQNCLNNSATRQSQILGESSAKKAFGLYAEFLGMAKVVQKRAMHPENWLQATNILKSKNLWRLGKL